MGISKRTIKILEAKICLNDSRAERPIPILASLMFDIPDPYDKKLADMYWKHYDEIQKRMDEVFEVKGAMGKHLTLEEFVKMMDECANMVVHK